TVESTSPMAKPVQLEQRSGIASRLGAFVAEHHPFALEDALAAFERASTGGDLDEAAFRQELTRLLQARPVPAALGETTPRVSVEQRLQQAREALLEDCDGFLRREAIASSLTNDERLELLRGMLLTRATDNRLKTFFTSGEIRYAGAPFQGKGFRSLGQEAIY